MSKAKCCLPLLCWRKNKFEKAGGLKTPVV